MEKDSRMTIEDLAVLMEKRFAEQEQRLDKKLDQKLDEKLEHFAAMIARSFAHMDNRITEFEEHTNENFGKIRRDILNLDDRFVTHREFNQFKLKLKSGQ